VQRAQDIAVHAKLLHTAEGPPIRDAIVSSNTARSSRSGRSRAVTIPAGMKTLNVEVATPGLVDAHSVVGLAGAMNQPQDQDQHDPTAPIQPELRAIDAYNARERLVEWVRGFGVTTIHTGTRRWP
jgi:imidazolonepropionase-like amidohydrolase